MLVYIRRFAVEAFLIRDGKILLSRRGPDRHGAGQWALVGGHVETGELCCDALLRELREELGDEFANALDTAAFELVSFVDDRRPAAEPPVHYVHASFVVEVPVGVEPVNAEPTLCAELAWFPATALPPDSQLYPPHIMPLRNYLTGRTYSVVANLT